MKNVSEVGENLVGSVYKMFSINEPLRRISQGIEWGKPGRRQRLWWETPVARTNGEPDLVRMRILTEVAGLPSNPQRRPDGLPESLLYACGVNLWGGLMFEKEMDGNLCIGTALSVDASRAMAVREGYSLLGQPVIMYSQLLFRAMVAQAAVRDALFGGDVGPSQRTYPGAGTARDMAGLGASMDCLIEDWDEEEVRAGVDADLAFLTKQFQKFPCLLCNRDGGKLVAEFPFGKLSSLLRIDSTAEHPIFGPAINISLLLPLDDGAPHEMLPSLLEMNSGEQAGHGLPWTLGSWCRDDHISPCPAYRIWIPNGMFQRSLLINLAMGMVTRARQCCEQMTGMPVDAAHLPAKQTIVRHLGEIYKIIKGGGNPK